MRLFLLSALILTGACATPLRSNNSEVRDFVRACIFEQADMCADLICEGDTHEPEIVIIAVARAVDVCFEDPEFVGKEYFDKSYQDDLETYWNNFQPKDKNEE